MIQSQVNENMHSFKLILSEVNKLQESEVLLLPYHSVFKI